MFAILTVAAAILGPPLAALVCSCVSALLAWSLYAKYRRDVSLAHVEIPPHRERLDLIVAGDARAALVVGLAVSAALVAVRASRPELGLAGATPVLLEVAAAAVYLSSLVDWYVILPRITGLLGVRPCRAPDGEHLTFPRTWREMTRWWYIHRIVAALALRFGLSFAVVLTAKEHLSIPGGASVVAAAAVGAFAAYMAAVPRAVWEAGHPTLTVGRTVRRQKTARASLLIFRIRDRRLSIPGLKHVPLGRKMPREYVYDIALEQVQLVPAAARERHVPVDDDGALIYEKNPGKLALKQLAAAAPVPADKPFAGCRQHCAGINWYCIDNPRCFRPK